MIYGKYTSFQELAEAYKIPPINKTTKDKEKLKSQKDKFLSKHRCRGCNQPMTWIGDNIMTCTNPKCKGIKIKNRNEDESDGVRYITSYNLLDEVGSDIAGNLFKAEV